MDEKEYCKYCKRELEEDNDRKKQAHESCEKEFDGYEGIKYHVLSLGLPEREAVKLKNLINNLDHIDEYNGRRKFHFKLYYELSGDESYIIFQLFSKRQDGGLNGIIMGDGQINMVLEALPSACDQEIEIIDLNIFDNMDNIDKLERFTNLKELNLEFKTDKDIQIDTQKKTTLTATDLKITASGSVKKQLEYFLFPNIEKLNFAIDTRNKITDEDLYAWIERLKTLKELEIVVSHREAPLQDMGSFKIKNGLPTKVRLDLQKLGQLQKFELRGYHMDSYMRLPKSVEMVILSDNNADFITELPNLRYLDLSGCYFERQSITRLQKLKYLSIGGTIYLFYVEGNNLDKLFLEATMCEPHALDEKSFKKYETEIRPLRDKYDTTAPFRWCKLLDEQTDFKEMSYITDLSIEVIIVPEYLRNFTNLQVLEISVAVGRFSAFLFELPNLKRLTIYDLHNKIEYPTKMSSIEELMCTENVFLQIPLQPEFKNLKTIVLRRTTYPQPDIFEPDEPPTEEEQREIEESNIKYVKLEDQAEALMNYYKNLKIRYWTWDGEILFQEKGYWD